MAAFINALREEGTKEDCLAAIERLWDQLAAARLAGKIEGMEAAERLCEFMLWQPDGTTPDPQFLRGYSEATDDCMNAIRAKIAELEASSTEET